MASCFQLSLVVALISPVTHNKLSRVEWCKLKGESVSQLHSALPLSLYNLFLLTSQITTDFFMIGLLLILIVPMKMPNKSYLDLKSRVIWEPQQLVKSPRVFGKICIKYFDIFSSLIRTEKERWLVSIYISFS